MREKEKWKERKETVKERKEEITFVAAQSSH